MDPLNASQPELSRGHSNLPLPPPEAIEHSQIVLNHIVNAIRNQNGLISFAEYMNLALYAPNLGYYAAGNQKFGKSGDFITAPELSPLFSGCLAQEIATVLRDLQGGDILEIGAGSGIMAADILLALKALNQLPSRYFILEISPELKERQQQTLQIRCPDLCDRVTWLDKLPDHKLKGVILANEVCDAMPVHRFIQKDSAVFELCVSENKGKLIWHPIPIDESKSLARNNLQFFLDLDLSDYCSEINLFLKPWIQTISDCLAQGVCLLVDYGFPRSEYYHPDRSMGTLMCHYQHHAHSDPFFYPGLQDITAHVDFTTIAKAAEESRLEVLGFTNQASFLLSCGLLELARQGAEPLTPKVSHAIQTLTSPAEMGELFKIIALGKNYTGALKGFMLSDKRHRL